MLQTTDAVKLSGLENFVENEELVDQDQLNALKSQVSILHQGFAVHVKDCKSCRLSNNYYIVEITLMSTINGMPVFGDVKLKLTKPSATKLMRLLEANKDPFENEYVNKKQKY